MKEEIVKFISSAVFICSIGIGVVLLVAAILWVLTIFVSDQPYEECSITAKAQGTDNYMVKGIVNKTCIYYKDGKRIEVKL